MRGGLLKLCAAPRSLFKDNISDVDLCLYLVYSKRLKLIAASNAGVYEQEAQRIRGFTTMRYINRLFTYLLTQLSQRGRAMPRVVKYFG